MTKEEAKGILKVIVMTYDNFELSAEKIDLWHELLEDIDYQKSLKAVKSHIKTNKFPPTVAEIREAVKADHKPTHGYEDSEIYRDFLKITGGDER